MNEFAYLAGSSAERHAASREIERLTAALVRGEAQISGARVRVEWVDPKPDWIDEWANGFSGLRSYSTRTVQEGVEQPVRTIKREERI